MTAERRPNPLTISAATASAVILIQLAPAASNGADSNPADLKKAVHVGPGHTAMALADVPRSSSLSAKVQFSKNALLAP